MTTASINWSLFDRHYPVENGIVNALPPDLTGRHLAASTDTKTFAAVHAEVMADRPKVDFVKDQTAMAAMQMDFYDRFALGFQAMDDTDQANGGVFWWKVKRLGLYDALLLENPGLHWSWQHKKKSLLFVGAGNGRLVRFFTQRGFDVVATDISRNMLEVGKRENEKRGITNVTYVAQNAEIHFPFKTDSFDNVYSLCVMNHIVNWDNYILEKMRCVRRGGVVLERLPNVCEGTEAWEKIWKQQGDLYSGIEAKAMFCSPASVRAKLTELGIPGEVWTHDHQTNLITFPKASSYSPRFGLPLNRYVYWLRSFFEDAYSRGAHDGKGIYTMFRVVK